MSDSISVELGVLICRISKFFDSLTCSYSYADIKVEKGNGDNNFYNWRSDDKIFNAFFFVEYYISFDADDADEKFGVVGVAKLTGDVHHADRRICLPHTPKIRFNFRSNREPEKRLNLKFIHQYIEIQFFS